MNGYDPYNSADRRRGEPELVKSEFDAHRALVTESLSDSAIELDGCEPVVIGYDESSVPRGETAPLCTVPGCPCQLRAWSRGTKRLVTESPSHEVAQCPCGSALEGECELCLQSNAVTK